MAGGTSVPELVTTVIAQLSGRRDIGLGTILFTGLSSLEPTSPWFCGNDRGSSGVVLPN